MTVSYFAIIVIYQNQKNKMVYILHPSGAVSNPYRPGEVFLAGRV